MRLPILVHSGYKMYHKHFFNQFIIIFFYAFIGNILFVLISMVLNRVLLEEGFSHRWSYSQMAMFSAATSMVDAMPILSLLPNKNFYFFLGIYKIGNCISVDIFQLTHRLAYSKEESGSIF